MWSKMRWNNFSWKCLTQCFHVDIQMLKYMSFSVSSVDQKFGKSLENLGKPCFSSQFYFSSSWPIYNQSPHSSHLHSREWRNNNIHCQTPTAIHNCYEDFKAFAKVAFYNINMWGCTRGWMSLDLMKKKQKSQILISYGYDYLSLLLYIVSILLDPLLMVWCKTAVSPMHYMLVNTLLVPDCNNYEAALFGYHRWYICMM